MAYCVKLRTKIYGVIEIKLADTQRLSGARESARPIIQDFQQTTTASIGQLAQAIVCSSSAEPGSDTAAITTQILQSYLSSPVVQPTASPCLLSLAYYYLCHYKDTAHHHRCCCWLTDANILPTRTPASPRIQLSRTVRTVRLPRRGLVTGGMRPGRGQMSSIGARREATPDGRVTHSQPLNLGLSRYR